MSTLDVDSVNNHWISTRGQSLISVLTLGPSKALKNYRPVSGLCFMSNLVEWVVVNNNDNRNIYIA